jgi:hypothetical protein
MYKAFEKDQGICLTKKQLRQYSYYIARGIKKSNVFIMKRFLVYLLKSYCWTVIVITLAH